nr:oriC-binding nucleoid-associated protein [Klebsiella pneumoniae]
MNADNIQRNNSDYKMDTKMTVLDYLLKFRKISSLESLENYLITLTTPD